jgi:hypothetical protein
MEAFMLICFILVANPNISEEFAFLIGKYSAEVFFDAFHGLVVRSNTCSNETERMWVSVENVHSAFSHILDHIFCDDETSWPTSNNSKSVLFF